MAELLPPPFKPGSGVAPASRIELSISCRKVMGDSRSDQMVVLFVVDPADGEWKELGRTEVIKNTVNPDYVKKFTMQYYFEESKKLKFEVYRVMSSSSPTDDLSSHRLLGETECTLGQIVSSHRLIKQLEGEKKKIGQINVSSEELRPSKLEDATMVFCAHKLDKKDVFGLSDPYLIFSKSNPDGSFTVVYKTEPIMVTLNPTWKPFTISLTTLCNGDYDRPILVECYDWNSSGRADFIGSFTTSMAELSCETKEKKVFDCISNKERAKRGARYKNSGTVELLSCTIEKTYTFLDYLKGGTSIHCTFAVNLAASNGHPRNPDSLHYMDPHKANPYETAIKAVGDIIKDYNSDRKFCALGFGARLPPSGEVSHEFALNGDPDDPFCCDIDEVLREYRRVVQKIQLYGPSHLAPCVKHVAKIAETSREGRDYYILIILTDGSIADMPKATEAIVEAATLPLSIIIIGVGDGDFGNMKILEGDEVRLESNGRKAERDIVQFVPMRDFLQPGVHSASAQARLVHEVLEEVPGQLLSYMLSQKVQPRERI